MRHSLKEFDKGKKRPKKLNTGREKIPIYGQLEPGDPQFNKSPFSVLFYNFRFLFPDSWPAKFNAQLVRDMILLYTKPGDKVFDPFVGSGEVAVHAGILRRYCWGGDLSPTAIEISKMKVEDHEVYGVPDFVTLEVANAKKIPLDAYSQNLCVTSPPFGTVIDAKHLHYSSDEECMGNIDDYDKFVPDFRKAIKEIYRVLDHNGLAIIEMRDRGKGMFIPLGVITMVEMIKIGFEPWGMPVSPWYPYAMWPYGPKEARKFIPAHAYLCIGRKTTAGLKAAKRLGLE